jgi:hypothetical protein
MDVVNEFYHGIIYSFTSEDLVKMLQKIKIQKENEIVHIKDKIIKYEEKRRTHEVWYQSLPTFRKFFTGRPPSHHQAVEYLVNVKQRLSNIEEIKRRIAELDRFIALVNNEPGKKEIILPHDIIDEIKQLKESGGYRI